MASDHCPVLDHGHDPGAVELRQAVGIAPRFHECGDLRLHDIVEVLRFLLVALIGLREVGGGRGAVRITHDESEIGIDGDLDRRYRRQNSARHALGEGARRQAVGARYACGQHQGGDDRR
jgi:hypothetical protein